MDLALYEESSVYNANVNSLLASSRLYVASSWCYKAHEFQCLREIFFLHFFIHRITAELQHLSSKYKEFSSNS